MSDVREEGTERLVAGLVQDLKPVKPLPRLAVSVGVVLAIWSGLVALVLLDPASPGASRPLADASVARVWTACLLAFAVAAVAGCISALAAGRPGQDRVESVSLWAAGAALVTGLASCAVGLLVLGMQPGDSLAVDGACLEKGVVIDLLPLAVLLAFVFRGWVGRPLLAAAIALAGGTALGTVITLLGCEAMSPRHLLLGHADVPFLLAVLGSYPLALALRRFAR